MVKPTDLTCNVISRHGQLGLDAFAWAAAGQQRASVARARRRRRERSLTPRAMLAPPPPHLERERKRERVGGAAAQSACPQPRQRHYAAAACGIAHSLLLTDDGALYACGRGTTGQVRRVCAGRVTLIGRLCPVHATVMCTTNRRCE